MVYKLKIIRILVPGMCLNDDWSNFMNVLNKFVCFFTLVTADQVYGDQEMHSVVRKNCIDYMVSMNNNKI